MDVQRWQRFFQIPRDAGEHGRRLDCHGGVFAVLPARRVAVLTLH
jgi:hypothetical protein